MNMEYDNFDIIDIAVKCGIRVNTNSRNGIEYKALCPFCGDVKYHMGLNKNKGVFHCFRCGAGGNSVSLYAAMRGITTKDAYIALKKTAVELTDIVPCAAEEPICPISKRHEVYSDFLGMLRLENRHTENLINRGLSLSDIHRLMYKSLPLDEKFRRQVLDTLALKHDLVGVPGFYTDNYGARQMYIKSCGGILIPVRDKNGYIQGLQIRLDVSKSCPEKKFRWFSSRYFSGGTGAKPWVHVTGDTSANEACLTEGAMKADITSVLSGGRLFAAVPGVNAVGLLPEILRSLGITKVYEMFDMDKKSKPEVKKALVRLEYLLEELGIEYVSCSWNPAYKGVDDYYLYKKQKTAA